MKKQNTSHSYLSIKKKLITTVAMLLVATFMVASSSYAWFTLSTAPEVTGIKTSVGSNGSLEIALNVGQDITSAVGDSGNNATWGNLVDLLSDDYGLQDIALYPSVIVLGADEKVAPGGAILATPEYGADGRVESLLDNAYKGDYNGSNFVWNPDNKGVSGIGTVSNMTAQQIAFSNAKGKIKTALNLAKTRAERALAVNGAGLVNLVLAYANANEDAKYDVAAIGDLLRVLNGEAVTVEIPAEEEGGDPTIVTVQAGDSVVASIEEAMTYFIVASVAGTDETKNLSDTEFEALEKIIINTCESAFPNLAEEVTFTVGDENAITVTFNASNTVLGDVYTKYIAIKNAIEDANEAYNTATTNGNATKDIAQDDVAEMLTPLMNISEVTVNGKTSSDIANADPDTLEDIAADIMSNGAVVIEMSKNSGVFADIATISENIVTSFKSKINGDAFNFPLAMMMTINMKTVIASGEFISLAAASQSLPEPPQRSDSDNVTQKITTLYGYSLDFAFRTNAFGSNLMLQTTPANRIYSSGGSTATQGGGSTMTFSVVDETFGLDDIQKLIANIRIVFTDTTTGEILAAAVLDAEKADKVGTSITADIKLCKYDVVDIKANNADTNNTLKTLSFGETIIFEEPDANGKTLITPLDQNVEKYVSVYVYLDGQTVDNSDVASKLKSATGTMNLQFSSDAELVPMDYADFKAPSSN